MAVSEDAALSPSGASVSTAASSADGRLWLSTGALRLRAMEELPSSASTSRLSMVRSWHSASMTTPIRLNRSFIISSSRVECASRVQSRKRLLRGESGFGTSGLRGNWEPLKSGTRAAANERIFLAAHFDPAARWAADLKGNAHAPSPTGRRSVGSLRSQLLRAPPRSRLRITCVRISTVLCL